MYLVGQLQLARDDIRDGLDAADCESGGEECHEWRDDCDSNSDSNSDSDGIESGEDFGEDTDVETDEDTDSEEDEGIEIDQQTSYDRSI
ncbi:hypothetical protein MRS44_016937 [Fusarium solani]|uniref:uncharacterized protein n=1 Tax=Fusarium solani TaxID=169388 RepID=UPI0032C45468|nr:hypothetical protein MRS44_016937 [Fusarium solani]